ncbi:MAG: hypothetical protein HYW26_03645 [Candidatus Aenigmarchaeota archaeon]|nr:hypothetical protein [Candidatus Aenigmarchaeota archaeon]
MILDDNAVTMILGLGAVGASVSYVFIKDWTCRRGGNNSGNPPADEYKIERKPGQYA